MPEIQVTPFGTPIREFKPSHDSCLYDPYLKQYQLELDRMGGTGLLIELIFIFSTLGNFDYSIKAVAGNSFR